MKTADGSGDLKDEKEALDLISKILDELKSEYEKINLFFKHKYYAAPE